MVVHVLFDVGDAWRALLLGAPPALFWLGIRLRRAAARGVPRFRRQSGGGVPHVHAA